MNYRRKLSDFATIIEQLNERIAELSVINRASAIITSSLDIEEVFDRFVTELKKIIDINWAAVTLTGNEELHFLALFSEVDSPWKVRERIPVKGTPTEWVVTHKKALVESDVLRKSRFATAGSYRQSGIRSVANLPLIAKDKAIGSLIVASRQPNAYGPKPTTILKQVAAQIAMPVENSRLYAEVKEQARVDKLTELFNRRSLDEVIISEINRHTRYGGVFSLAILDLDSFKAFNDKYGHLAGDDLLRKIASAIKNSIRSADQAFRYGGDEFAILLPNTVTGAADLVAERIRKQIASTVDTGQIPVSASLGLASWPANGTKANELIAAADAALYQAKRSGGNRCHRA